MHMGKIERAGSMTSQAGKQRNLATVRKRRVERVPLTPIEKRIYDACLEAAVGNLPAPSVETLTVMIGASAPSTVPGIMGRLEAKGYITRNIYQRGRQVCIVDRGICTLAPANTAPHWRLRPRTESPPTPAIQQLRQREQSLTAMIEQEARSRGVPFATMLEDLVYIGWHGYRAEKEEGL